MIPRAPPKTLLAKLPMGFADSVLIERRQGILRFCRKILALKGINITDDVFMFLFKPRRELTIHQDNLKSQLLNVRSTSVTQSTMDVIGSVAGSLFG